MMRAVTYPPALHGAARADASGGSILGKMNAARRAPRGVG